MIAVVLQVCGEVHRILAHLSMTVIATKIKLLRGLVSYQRYISDNFIWVINPERTMVKVKLTPSAMRFAAFISCSLNP